jgi:hypothetical protein
MGYFWNWWEATPSPALEEKSEMDEIKAYAVTEPELDILINSFEHARTVLNQVPQMLADERRKVWLEAAEAAKLQKDMQYRHANNEVAVEMGYLEAAFRAKATEQGEE